MTKLRWQLRFASYEKAYRKLVDAVTRKEYDDLEMAGLIQTFVFTFELGWKTLKDLLEQEGYQIDSPRNAIKQAFQAGYITDADLWLKALQQRNVMAHTYDEDETKQAIMLIKEQYFPMLERLYLFLQEKLKS